MISSINNNHIMMQSMATNTVTNSKAAEEANESPSEKIAETSNQSSQTVSNHVIDTYA